MKLLLCSHLLNSITTKEIERVLGKTREDISVAIITTAKNYKTEEYALGRIKENIQYVTDQGFELKNIKPYDIEEIETEALQKDLEKFDVTLILGGNTFYILDRVKKYKFGEVLKNLLNDDKLIVAQSAGAILFSPSIEIAANEFHYDDNQIGLKDLTALNIVDYAVFPHYKEVYEKNTRKLRSKTDYDIYGLKDEQSILIEDEKITFIGGEPKIFRKS